MLAYIFRAPILRNLASTWIVESPPGPAVAIVVLGGGRETRPFAAAKLYHAGYAPLILIPRTKSGPAEQLGLIANDAEIARQILLKQGVPASAIQFIGQDVSSTYEETQAVLQWLQTRNQGFGVSDLLTYQAAPAVKTTEPPPVPAPASAATTTDPPVLLIPTEKFHTRRTRWIFEHTLGTAASISVIAIPHEEYPTDTWWEHEQGLIDFQNEIIKHVYYRWKY